MNVRKKVLFFVPSVTGGAERMTIAIARMLPKEQYEVKFVIVNKTLGTIINFIPSEYKILHIPIHNIYCFTTIRMIRIILSQRADIVFCSLHYLNVRLIVAAKLTNTKVVVRMNIELGKISKYNQLLVKSTYRYASKIISQQEEMRQEALRILSVSEDMIVTLPNPIDVELIDSKSAVSTPYSPEEKGVKYVLVARFSRVKGQDLLVRAFKRVLEKQPESHLYFVGMYDWDQQYDRDVKSYVDVNNLTERVHFIGFDDNPYRWMKYADCYVMPSRLEGLPNSLIDAMYLGIPVVATKCIPVISRLVQDGYNGILVETENANSIAEGMLNALSLKKYKMTYESANSEDFLNLF